MRYNEAAVGKRIRQARKDKKWSQDKLIEELQKRQTGINRNNLSAIENGKEGALGNISLTALCAMCDMFDCDMGYLLGEYEQRHRVAAEVCDATKLSSPAVDTLMGMNYYAKYGDNVLSNPVGFISQVDILSRMLESAEFVRILGNIAAAISNGKAMQSASVEEVQDAAMSDDVDTAITLAPGVMDSVADESPVALSLSAAVRRFQTVVDHISDHYLK